MAVILCGITIWLDALYTSTLTNCSPKLCVTVQVVAAVDWVCICFCPYPASIADAETAPVTYNEPVMYISESLSES